MSEFHSDGASPIRYKAALTRAHTTSRRCQPLPLPASKCRAKCQEVRRCAPPCGSIYYEGVSWFCSHGPSISLPCFLLHSGLIGVFCRVSQPPMDRKEEHRHPLELKNLSQFYYPRIVPGPFFSTVWYAFMCITVNNENLTTINTIFQSVTVMKLNNT